MNDIAIKVEGLSKRYWVGHQRKAEPYSTLRDTLTQNVSTIARKTWDMMRGREIVQGDEVEEFWALKDINFEIKKGDRVGIIGRNGAGKSTLLKILSRITEPTTGRIQIAGRVASLLEVGTGFHPELTGRENIFLNGAILGMKRTEIQRKFDEIVAFAEVEKFLDTPVKRYSSGMYVRLAFAVAAHLEPEILIVDEVLAVGDLKFQEKCLRKMSELSSHGLTIIFVSHNMNAIKVFCSSGIMLNCGRVNYVGKSNDVINFYTETVSDKWNPKFGDINTPYVYDVFLTNGHGQKSLAFCEDDQCFFNIIIYTANKPNITFGFTIFNSENIGIFSSITSDSIYEINFKKCSLSIELPVFILNSGQFRIEGALTDDYRTYEQSECFLFFSYIRTADFDIKGNKSKGLLRVNNPWHLK